MRKEENYYNRTSIGTDRYRTGIVQYSEFSEFTIHLHTLTNEKEEYIILEEHISSKKKTVKKNIKK